MATNRYLDEWQYKLDLITAWCRDGLTNEQISKNIGITRTTLQDWLRKYPELKTAMKKGKEVVDIEVENALLKRALGYKYVEETTERVFNKQTESYELVVTKKVVKEVQPDTTAQIWWLKNRKPETWKDRKQIEADVKNENKNFDMSNLTDEQLEKILKSE